MNRKPEEKISVPRITEMLGSMPGWTFDASKNRIEKRFTRKHFLDAVRFINEIAPIAEAQDHHPDLLLSDYKNVFVMISTHSAGGVTQNDFDLAKAIDQLH